MKYINYFTTHAEYISYQGSDDWIIPNLSFCELEDDLHLNPWPDPRIIAKFNVTSTNEATTIMYSSVTSSFTEIEIDGVIQPSVVNTYTFDTTGKHTVHYTLANLTTIGSSAFRNCTNLISVTIPNSVTTIGDQAFSYCSGLTSITIPNSVTKIGNTVFSSCSNLTSVTIPDSVTTIGGYVFYECSGLTSVTVEATTPPTLGNDAFSTNASGRKIYVPSESVEAYKAATNWSNYASDIEAIP